MNGKVVIGTELDTKSFDAQIKQVERELDLLERSADESSIPKQFRRSEEEANKLNAEIEKTRNKLGDLRKKQLELENKNINTNWQNISGVINNVNGGLSDTVKKVARWGLALFGILSAYNAIRGAMSLLSQYDEQLAANIEYIQFALANTLKPIIEVILNLIVKLLQYINYIAKAWTGKNLFTGAKAFESMKKSASSTAKSAKEINKQLAGFDEMNVLSDTSSAGGAGGTGGDDFKTPNIDLTGMQGEVPQWLKWIVDNKDLILAVMAGVAAGLLAWKLGLSGIQSLGIGLAIAGIVYTIESIMAYLQDPSWENFGKIITGIGLAVAGVAIIFGAWPVAIAGAIVAVIGIIISNWEKIKAFLQNGIEWLKTSGKGILNWLFGDFLDPLYDAFVNNLQLILNFFDTTFTNAKKILDNIIAFIKNVFTGNWKGAWENIKNIFFSIFNIIKSYFFTVFGVIKNTVVGIAGTVGNIIAGVFKAVVNGVMGTIESILNSPIKTVNSLIGIINEVPGINLRKLSTFKLPRLAKGGIINQPGRGIPVGNAIAGESGREAVLPLTDPSVMALIGESIGKYVNINATVPVYVGNRQIAREIRQINANNDFAYNR